MRWPRIESRAPLGIGKATALALLFALALFYLVGPPAWMLISSISSNSELHVQPPHWLPHAPTLENYATLFQLPGGDAAVLDQNPQIRSFPRAFVNSMVIAGCTMLICILFGSVSAYSISRFLARSARRWILLGLLASRMIPVAAIIIPIYFALNDVQLLDTLTGLIIVDAGLLLPFVIWILEGYYRDFPREIEEAAVLDGCTPTGAFFRVVLPLSKNALFAAGAFVFISVWSDFIVGLTLTSSAAAWPLSVALAQALNPINEPNWGLLNSAGIVAAVIPAALAFIFRGAVMRGMLSGAVKG